MTAWKSEVIYRDSSFLIGRFRCPPGALLWRRENISGQLPMLVFPRTAVTIHQADFHPVVANPNQAMLYDPQRPYRRRVIDPRGDFCEFFCVVPHLMDELLRNNGWSGAAGEHEFFQVDHANCPATVYLTQRRVFFAVANSVDPGRFRLWIQEQLLDAFSLLLRHNSPRDISDPSQSSAVRDQVESAKEFMACNHRRAIDLNDIAAAVGISMYHLSRCFKRVTGITMHQFLQGYRLRSSLELLTETDRSITDIALDFSFSSHSHFSNAFRKSFQTTPSKVRRCRLV